ncbi:hypothetical protein [Chelatococcus reniformis]|uniref:Uncharacterized protein n=1 Tax=Chelatococcus reniformis TaxID=1494448 RepID=A0A916XAI3_9HYPH|nr:hypothetical protein [Chelatococcus reniformis]GGC59724.1 hypothetical protein GCM10010994_18080 [Chelatococcus reniformis]
MRGRGLLRAALMSGALLEGAEASEWPGATPFRNVAIAGGEAPPQAIDTEHIFGFTEGTDIGAPGETEFESETTGRFGRRGGRFQAIDSALTLKVPVSSQFRLAPAVSFSRYALRNVPELRDVNTGHVDGASLEARLRLLDRASAPFGLTLNVAPGFGGVDGASGRRARSYGADFGVFLDREIVPGKLVAALNLSYDMGSTRLRAIGPTVRGSGTDVSAALAYRALPGIFIGAETRYLRAYEGLGLDRFVGQAVYVGPTFYASLPAGVWVSVAWSAQVAGGAAGTGERLDLTSFDRHQVRLRIGGHF